MYVPSNAPNRSVHPDGREFSPLGTSILSWSYLANVNSKPWVSILVPARNEATSLPWLLDDIRALTAEHGVTCDVIVADGGSTDGTVAVARDAGAVVVEGARGRGAQLRAAAEAATAPVLLALHADARLDAAARAALGARLRAGIDPREAWVFRLRIAADAAAAGASIARSVALRLVAFGANLRTRLFSLPYGDQGLLLTRDAYDRVGGYQSLPLFEDVTLVRALAAQGRIRVLPAAITVSARRWERDGVFARSLRNLRLLYRWSRGVSVEQLAREYERGR